jgi:hypothetical protein
MLNYASVSKPIFGPKKLVYYVKLPFIGHYYSNLIKRSLLKLNSQINFHIDLRFVFVNTYNISSLFPFKDVFTNNMIAKVVYSVGCLQCPANYIGMTSRLLSVRLREHREGLKGTRFSSLAEHTKLTNHSINWNDPKVLQSDSSDINLMYLESLLIAQLKPVLNNRQTSVTLNLFS